MDDDQLDIVPHHGLQRMSQARTIPAAEFDLMHTDADSETRRSVQPSEPFHDLPHCAAMERRFADAQSIRGDSEDTETLRK